MSKSISKSIVLILVSIFFCSCKQYIKITSFKEATREGSITGDRGNRVPWREDYYFIEYKNMSDRKLLDTLKNFFLKNYDKIISKYHEYDIFFCFKSENFNEDALIREPDILKYQIDEKKCVITSYSGDLIGIVLYDKGKIEKKTDFYPPWFKK